MKKILIVTILVIIGSIVAIYISEKKPVITHDNRSTNNPGKPASNNNTRFTKLDYNGTTYLIYYSSISGSNISIIPNFEKQQSATRIAKENDCKVATSGGFYTKENAPLGLLRIEGKDLSRKITQTNLVNGYFYIDNKGNASIGSSAPEDTQTILQTGPLFTSNKVFPTKTDEMSRRIVLIEDTHGVLYLASIITDKNTFSGPLLSELPAILFSINEPFSVAQILNLDGGSASFYKDETGFSLPELVYIGSMICIK